MKAARGVDRRLERCATGGAGLNATLIERHWDGVGEKQLELVERFYARLFERHPHFRALFHQPMGPQMEKMVHTLALVARESDAPDLIRPHMIKVGGRHARYGLTRDDFDDLVEVLIGMLGEYNRRDWSAACEQAWRDALYRVVLPFMIEGMSAAAGR